MNHTTRYFPKTLLRPRTKPFLIWAAPPFGAFAALGSAAFATLAALDGQPGAIAVVDHPISRASYLALVYPFLVGAAIELAAAYGLLMARADCLTPRIGLEPDPAGPELLVFLRLRAC